MCPAESNSFAARSSDPPIPRSRSLREVEFFLLNGWYAEVRREIEERERRGV